MRARMALHLAGIEVEIREIALRKKPRHLLHVSPKGTVPVLILDDGQIIDQSLDIMVWALSQSDPHGYLSADAALANRLITENDTAFKTALDAYKYPERYPNKTQEEHRKQGEFFLAQLEQRLTLQMHLVNQMPTYVDIAIFPFVRQFAAVDKQWFDNASYAKLASWLAYWINSSLFEAIMQKIPTYFEE
jgi:glutathione S-transferase